KGSRGRENYRDLPDCHLCIFATKNTQLCYCKKNACHSSPCFFSPRLTCISRGLCCTYSRVYQFRIGLIAAANSAAIAWCPDTNGCQSQPNCDWGGWVTCTKCTWSLPILRCCCIAVCMRETNCGRELSANKIMGRWP